MMGTTEMNDLTVYISLGSQTYLGINEKNELVLFTTKDNVIQDYVSMGKFTKARAEEIKGYIEQLSIHAIKGVIS